MNLWIEIIKFIIFSGLIVLISKYILVKILRKLAESLKLKPNTVGNIAGFATSVPELLTVSFSAATGLIGASVYNIIGSNIINIFQYISSIFLNKNQKLLQNRAIKIDIILVLLTILIPIILLFAKVSFTIWIVPIFIILFILFFIINQNIHKIYLKEIDNKIENEILKEENKIRDKRLEAIKYGSYLLITGIALFIIGNLLSEVLEKLAMIFNIPEFVLGIALGFITSLPELITFFESQKHHKESTNELLGVVEATNNLLSSNLLNLFIIQSIGIIIFTIIGK